MAGPPQRIHHATIGGLSLRLQIMGGRSAFAVLAKIFKLFGPEIGNFVMENANRLPELRQDLMAAFGLSPDGTPEETVAKYKMRFIAQALPLVADGSLMERFEDDSVQVLGDLLFRQRLAVNDITIEDPNILDTMILSPMTYGHIVLWAIACNLDPTQVASSMIAGSESTNPTRQPGSVSARAS